MAEIFLVSLPVPKFLLLALGLQGSLVLRGVLEGLHLLLSEVFLLAVKLFRSDTVDERELMLAQSDPLAGSFSE